MSEQSAARSDPGVSRVNSADQVMFVLELVLALGPLAVYFLGLGLVNSQACPRLVNARADFVLLAVAFVPVILAPILWLVEGGYRLTALGVVGVAAGLFAVLMPAGRGGWVIYNVEAAQFRRILARACRREGWGVTDQDDVFVVGPVGLTVTVSVLPWLRNVTVRIAADGGGTGRASRDRLVASLGRELGRESMVPSATGASLVVIGAALLGVPMWYVFRHIEAIVEVVRHFLLA